jgi:hypothetical protein
VQTSREPIPVVLALANAGRPTRPPGAPAPQYDAGFSTLDSAAAILAALLPEQRIAARDLPALRELADAIAAITAALIAREQPAELELINDIARRASASRALACSGGSA